MLSFLYGATPNLFLLRKNQVRILRDVTKVKTPLKSGVFTLVNSARFEPATFGSASQRSIQLSYESI